MIVRSLNQLAELAEQHISRRTFGKVHGLRVEINDGKAVVRGRTGTYYTKQLALQAMLDMIGDETPVELDIEVGSGKPALRAWQR